MSTELESVSVGVLAMGLPGGASGQESSARAGDPGEAGLIPGSGRLAEGGRTAHSSILAWRVPQKEEPGGL